MERDVLDTVAGFDELASEYGLHPLLHETTGPICAMVAARAVTLKAMRGILSRARAGLVPVAMEHLALAALIGEGPMAQMEESLAGMTAHVRGTLRDEAVINLTFEGLSGARVHQVVAGLRSALEEYEEDHPIAERIRDLATRLENRA